ncbi:uncharacterized protein B0H64DRAFT_62359 [Chaetomium fimeti]|uniref:Uncharacterized protein n=1 Tax=Chaetomium fimeti TaxID=1854472 RepID=A0AAE0H7D0_9PEZI|nr:hypothetical protein B0H64DRAFT_62359 [Chaetomium fimeti]
MTRTLLRQVLSLFVSIWGKIPGLPRRSWHSAVEEQAPPVSHQQADAVNSNSPCYNLECDTRGRGILAGSCRRGELTKRGTRRLIDRGRRRCRGVSSML